MTFSLESTILLSYTIKLFLSVYTCTCTLKPLLETSLLILLDELRICIGSLTHIWNKLSTDCVHASSVNMFKNKIDKYLAKAGYT